MKKFLYILLFSMVALGANAQSVRQYYSLSWAFAFPVGDLNSFISRPGLVGGAFDGQIYFTDNIAVGFNFGWNNYQQTVDRQSYQVKDGLAVTANSYRYVHAIPAKVGVYYNFIPDSYIQPYAGLGIGLNYMSENVVVQDFDFYNTSWGFLASPEVGLYIFPTDQSWGFKVSCAYNFSTNSFNFAQRDYNLAQSLLATVGVTFELK